MLLPARTREPGACQSPQGIAAHARIAEILTRWAASAINAGFNGPTKIKNPERISLGRDARGARHWRDRHLGGLSLQASGSNCTQLRRDEFAGDGSGASVDGDGGIGF